MGGSSPQVVQAPQPSAASIAAFKQAQNADISTTETDLATQTYRNMLTFGAPTFAAPLSGITSPGGAAAKGALNGMTSAALLPLGVTK